MIKYKYMSQWCGEIQPNLYHVIRETIGYICYYPFNWKMLYWKYNRRGW